MFYSIIFKHKNASLYVYFTYPPDLKGCLTRNLCLVTESRLQFLFYGFKRRFFLEDDFVFIQ